MTAQPTRGPTSNGRVVNRSIAPLDAVDAAAEDVKLTIRLEALASCQIFAQSANLIVLVPLVDPFLAPGNLLTQFVKKRSDRLNEDLSPSGLSAGLRHR